jgi:pimeloyl-ACP methyl ester carboxylesterase
MHTLTVLARWLGFAVALLLLPLALVTGVVAATHPVSLAGWGYVLTIGALGAGLVSLPFTSPKGKRWSGRLSLGAALLLTAVGCARCLAVGSGGEGMRLETWPDGSSARWVDRLLDERDIALLGLATLPTVGLIDRREASGVTDAFVRVYDEIDARHGALPSPFAATWLGLQRPAAFDVLIVDPPGRPNRSAGKLQQRAVVFLHGYAGNYVFECTLLARASRRLGFSTVCPSTGLDGYWWADEGPAILDATLAELRRRGVRRVVLAGLSNGGVSVARLAQRVARRGRKDPARYPQLSGVLLLFGGSRRASSAGVPTLVVHARSDARVSLASMRATARQMGGRLVTLRGDHFAMAKRPAAVAQLVTPFLRRVLR